MPRNAYGKYSVNLMILFLLFFPMSLSMVLVRCLLSCFLSLSVSEPSTNLFHLKIISSLFFSNSVFGKESVRSERSFLA